MAINPLQEVMALSNTQGLNIEALTNQLAGNTAQIQTLVNDNAVAGAGYITAVGDQAKAATESAMAKEQLKLKHQAIIGLDPNVMENEYSKSVAALNLAQTTYDENRKQYDAITSTNLLDDPLGYIFGQLQLPTVSAKVNNSVAAISAAEGNILARQTLLERQNNVVIADTLDADRRMLGAQAQMNLAKATMDVNKSKVGDLQTISQMQTAQISAANMAFDNKVKALQMQIQAAEAAGNRALRARQVAEMDEMKQLRIKELKLKMEEEADYTTKLSTIGQTLGYQVQLTPKVYKTLSKPSQQAIDTLMLFGKFGTDLTDSLKTLTNLPGGSVVTDTNKGMESLVKRLSEYTVSATSQLPKVPGMPGYVPPKEQGQYVLDKLQVEIEQSTSNPKSAVLSSSKVWDSNPNPTLVNPRLMQTVPLPNNSLASAFNTVLGLKGPDAQPTKADEQRAYKVVRDLVAAGKLSPDKAAADIVEYTKLGIEKSKQTYQYEMLGIKPPTDYYTEWASVGAFGKVIPVNMANPASVKNALIKDIRGLSAFSQATQEGLGTPISSMGAVGLFGLGAQVATDKLAGKK
jgi:hypothetical protein